MKKYIYNGSAASDVVLTSTRNEIIPLKIRVWLFSRCLYIDFFLLSFVNHYFLWKTECSTMFSNLTPLQYVFIITFFSVLATDMKILLNFIYCLTFIYCLIYYLSLCFIHHTFFKLGFAGFSGCSMFL